MRSLIKERERERVCATLWDKSGGTARTLKGEKRRSPTYFRTHRAVAIGGGGWRREPHRLTRHELLYRVRVSTGWTCPLLCPENDFLFIYFFQTWNSRHACQKETWCHTAENEKFPRVLWFFDQLYLIWK